MFKKSNAMQRKMIVGLIGMLCMISCSEDSFYDERGEITKRIEINLNGEKVIFLKPQSYMNLSGTVVSQFINFFKIDTSDLLVISDDLDLNVGNFKLRDKGSCGGHNGLRNIEACIHTQQYKRLKIGISNDKSRETKDYVLGRFSKDEEKQLQELFTSLVDVVDDYFKLDFLSLMNRYNRKNR